MSRPVEVSRAARSCVIRELENLHGKYSNRAELLEGGDGDAFAAIAEQFKILSEIYAGYTKEFE